MTDKTAGANSSQQKQDAAKAQEKVRQKTQDLLQQTADQSPPASKALEDASKDMDKAKQEGLKVNVPRNLLTGGK